MQTSVECIIKSAIKDHGRGWCFSAMDFVQVGSEESIRKALSSLCNQNFIRRLTQGIYDYPKLHKVLGVIPPDLHNVAEVIARKNGVHLQLSGAYAANLTGLSEQVPGRLIFLTDGPSRKVTVGNQEMLFRKVARKIMASAGTREGLVIQALKHMGKDHIDSIARDRIQRFLKISSGSEIRANTKYAPLWIRKIIFEIVGIKK